MATTLFPDSMLARLSAWIESHELTESGTLLRNQRVQTPSGGWRDTWQEVASSVPCAVLDTGAPSEQIVAQQTVGSITKTITFPRGTDVRGADRFRVGTITYLVVDVFEPSTFEVVRRVLARRTSLPPSP